MSMYSKAYATRDLVLQRLEEDLLGGPADSVLTEDPLARFVVGVLFPEDPEAAEPPNPDKAVDEEGSDGGEGAETLVDPGVSLARVRYPSSIGVTFAVRGRPEACLRVRITTAAYVAEGKEWHRTEVGEELDVPTDAGYSRHSVREGLDVVVHSRAAGGDDDVLAVTVALVNSNAASRGHRDAACWFNPVITVYPQGTELCERPHPVVPGTSEEELAGLELLYRDVATYAVGHGCGAVWDEDKPTFVRTTFLPRHDLLLSEAAGAPDISLAMDALAEHEQFVELERLVADYRRWIDDTAADTRDLDEDQTEALDRHMARARSVADRMLDGVTLLRTDPEVRKAFQLMNRAMAEQRSRQEFHRGGGIGDPPTTGGARWRPFQMGFILTNLRGLADPDSEDRNLADVLWFPTGGGKTEAYLGLIGIAILLRRLREPDAAGVSVLMRYTLRLLTLQQYERATGLICALEYVRRRELPDVAPISIGLWVGEGSTPNTIAKARTALKRQRSGINDGAFEGSDPVQLRGCPWCGSELTAFNYSVSGEHMIIECGFSACAFSSGLPVHIIDSDVYSNRPSLVLGTVDKFAMMPWKAEVGRLLGVPGGMPSPWRELPPDLIVQDELHLISGPLGTMVGLYETAVDHILGREHPPKVVASTATIRRASEQVRAVFARQARQFPPPGASYRDSYFAREAPADRKASRGYVGVMAPGASHATLMIRVYASLLQSASCIPDDDETADLYWTLLGYFNSLRVLGGARMQVTDDVPDQMKVIASRRGEPVRKIGAPNEMTSRKKSSEIPTELKILAKRRGETDAADVVLATNMISVGVDVDRLGLMAVMGQPQTTSEYIQATSRVGRQMPGLVVMIYNSSRSRDLSHYENFSDYHRALYRHVEATSATPFAPRALDRALHAVLVSLARHTIEGAAAGTAAGNAAAWREELQGLAQVFVDRARVVRGSVPDADSDEALRQACSDLIEAWIEGRPTHYAGWFDKWRGALLIDAGRKFDDGAYAVFPPQDVPWPTLTSMRDVDAESGIYLMQRRQNRAR